MGSVNSTAFLHSGMLASCFLPPNVPETSVADVYILPTNFCLKSVSSSLKDNSSHR